MYETGTVLELKKKRRPDKETKEAFAYNEVVVIGQSPISYGGAGEWSGVAATGVIICPVTNFGGNLDEPFGKLQKLYSVKSIPEQTQIPVGPMSIPIARPGASPEEVFATGEQGAAPEEGQIRARTSFGGPSPLGEVHNDADKSPL